MSYILSLPALMAAVGKQNDLHGTSWHLDYLDTAGFWRCMCSDDDVAKAVVDADARGQSLAPLRITSGEHCVIFDKCLAPADLARQGGAVIPAAEVVVPFDDRSRTTPTCPSPLGHTGKAAPKGDTLPRMPNLRGSIGARSTPSPTGGHRDGSPLGQCGRTSALSGVRAARGPATGPSPITHVHPSSMLQHQLSKPDPTIDYDENPRGEQRQSNTVPVRLAVHHSVSADCFAVLRHPLQYYGA